MIASRVIGKISSMLSVRSIATNSVAARISVAATLFALLSILAVRAGGNGHHGRYHQQQQQIQQQQQLGQRSLQAGSHQLPPSYSNNVNPFVPLYSNPAPPYGVPSPYGPPPPQQQQQPSIQQQQQQYPGVGNGGGYGPPQVNLAPRQYANSAPSYVPIQQAYTVAYYPTYQPTTPPAPTGPYVPAPPGQRPSCAKDGQTYCEEVDYYPTKLVLQLLENSDIDSFLVNDDGTSTRPYGYYNITPTYFYDYSYTTNSNGQPYSPSYYPQQQQQQHNRNKRQAADEDDMCPTSMSTIQAKAAENAKGDWKYIVNLPEVDVKYQQMVEVTKCRSQQCIGLCTPPSGSTSRCEQQYVVTRLFSLDASGNKLNNELFRFPHCCICKITPAI